VSEPSGKQGDGHRRPSADNLEKPLHDHGAHRFEILGALGTPKTELTKIIDELTAQTHVHLMRQ
jgi:hypothetical protein